jgi:hypothetical protein
LTRARRHSANSQSSAGKPLSAARSTFSNSSPPAQAEMAHGALVHALHDKRDGMIAFGE